MRPIVYVVGHPTLCKKRQRAKKDPSAQDKSAQGQELALDVDEMYRVACGVWKVLPSEFWRMCPHEWWLMFDGQYGDTFVAEERTQERLRNWMKRERGA